MLIVWPGLGITGVLSGFWSCRPGVSDHVVPDSVSDPHGIRIRLHDAAVGGGV